MFTTIEESYWPIAYSANKIPLFKLVCAGNWMNPVSWLVGSRKRWPIWEHCVGRVTWFRKLLQLCRWYWLWNIRFWMAFSTNLIFMNEKTHGMIVSNGKPRFEQRFPFLFIERINTYSTDGVQLFNEPIQSTGQERSPRNQKLYVDFENIEIWW